MYFTDLLTSLYKYLIGSEDYNNNIIRKHNRNLEKLGEFSLSTDTSTFVLNLHPHASALKYNTTEAILELLAEESKKWELQISKCIMQNNSIHIFLDRVLSFKKVIEQVLHQKHKYGSYKVNFLHRISVLTDIEELPVSELNLSQLRLLLLRDAIHRVLEFNECREETLQEISIIVSLNVHKNLKEKVISCGRVLSVKGKSNCVITAAEFYRKRTVDMRLMAQHKYGLRIASDVGWQEFFEKLGQAAVTIDLLQNKPSRTLTININDPMSSSSKGASFILYNCARLATLFKEFDKRVNAGVYPALPSVDHIDYSLLTQPEEWELLFLYVLQFPHVINSCIREILDGKINIHNLCSALSGMCSIFSIYYRRVRVLTEPRSHLFAVLHARIYLLKAVEQVLHNGLFLLNIQPVKQM